MVPAGVPRYPWQGVVQEALDRRADIALPWRVRTLVLDRRPINRDQSIEVHFEIGVIAYTLMNRLGAGLVVTIERGFNHPRCHRAGQAAQSEIVPPENLVGIRCYQAANAVEIAGDDRATRAQRFDRAPSSGEDQVEVDKGLLRHGFVAVQTEGHELDTACFTGAAKYRQNGRVPR